MLLLRPTRSLSANATTGPTLGAIVGKQCVQCGKVPIYGFPLFLSTNATWGPTLGAIVGKMPDCPFTSKRGFLSSEATIDARRSRR